ncbi:MAG: hypothetical protein CMP14_08490 [Rickettsiales bacterium]|nr:hypothetical protein [Rickettsiales bacterium]|tara:strand:- start:2325 stop:2555 length:231 start_codon:yes stop_codon:yes gene_type:complete
MSKITSTDPELVELVGEYIEYGMLIKSCQDNQTILLKKISDRMASNTVLVADKEGYLAECVRETEGLKIREVCDGK